MKEFWLWCLPKFEELSFEVAIGPSFYWLKPHGFNSDQKKWGFWALQNRCLGSGVENGWVYPMREGPSSKPNSLKLGTCQGQRSFTLGSTYQIPLRNWHCSMFVASPIVSHHVKLALLILWLKGGPTQVVRLAVSPTDATFLVFRELNKKLILHWIGT